jgi:hypothetical protein
LSEKAKQHQTQTLLLKSKKPIRKSSHESTRGKSLVKPLSEFVNSGFVEVYSTKRDERGTTYREPASEIFSNQNEEKNQKYGRGLLSANRYQLLVVGKWLALAFAVFPARSYKNIQHRTRY